MSVEEKFECTEKEEGRSISTKEMKRHFSSIGMGVFLLMVITLILQLVIGGVIGAMIATGACNASITTEPWFMWVLALVPMYVFAIPAAYFYLKKIDASVIEQQAIKVREWVMYLVMCVGIMVAGSLIGTALSSLINTICHLNAGNGVASMITGSNVLWNIIFVVILAPVVEELMFRRVLIERTIKYGDKTAILISGLFFGLFHGNFYQFFYAFGLGMMFAFVYIRTGKLKYTIGLHMAINFMGSVVAPAVISGVDLEGLASGANVMGQLNGLIIFGVYLFVLYSTAIAGIVLLVRKKDKFILTQGEYQLPEGKKVSTVICNPGTILYIAACCLMFLLNIVGTAV